MTIMPVPTNTDLAVQNNTTGQVDFLQFQGSTLVASDTVNYVPASWNVVAQGFFDAGNHEDMVIQSQTSGALDFLTLDNKGNLIGSDMSNVSLPPIVGQGSFGIFAPGQFAPTLVSQLANGELDMLGFNFSGQLVASDAIANTVGFGPAVGVGQATQAFPLFSGTGSSDSVVLQYPDGSIDAIGFSGAFGNGTLSASASFLLPGSAGSSPVEAVNQQDNFFGAGFGNNNILGGPGTGGFNVEGVQFVEQLANGSFNEVYADSGYGDAAHAGTLYASDLLNLSLPGWHAVDAGAIAREIFPIT
jgi:hypothetical protein